MVLTSASGPLLFFVNSILFKNPEKCLTQNLNSSCKIEIVCLLRICLLHGDYSDCNGFQLFYGGCVGGGVNNI